MNYQFTTIIEHEAKGYVALCQEIDVASQGDTINQARENLREAVELFLECAAQEEIQGLRERVWVKFSMKSSASLVASG